MACSHFHFFPNKAYDRLKPIKPDISRYIMAPCGKCPDCMRSKANQRAFKLKQEDAIAQVPTKWITLTYDEQHLPHTIFGDATLSRYDTRQFCQKLRDKNHYKWLRQTYDLSYGQYKKLKETDPARYQEIKEAYTPVKIYGAGEYGSHTERPHYHVFVFHTILSYDEIQELWSRGFVYDGLAEDGSFSYTTSYMIKDQQREEEKSLRYSYIETLSGLESKFYEDENDYSSLTDMADYTAEQELQILHRQKPYSFSSHNIGKHWIEDYANARYLMNRPNDPYIQDGNYSVAVPREWKKYLEENYGFTYPQPDIDPYEILNQYSKKYPYLTVYETIQKINGDDELLTYNKLKKMTSRKKHTNL